MGQHDRQNRFHYWFLANYLWRPAGIARILILSTLNEQKLYLLV